MVKIGLPVVVVIVLIIGIAIFAGREKPAPKISNPDEIVIEFESLKMTHGELYDLLKSNESIGASVLLDLIDRALLKEYNDEKYIDIDEIREEIEEEMEDDDFYETYAKIGLYKNEGEDDEDLIERIIEHKKLTLMKEAYARDNHEVKDEDVEEEFDNYREDVCVIPLTFDTRQEADEFYASLEGLSDEDIFNEFANEYIRQQEAKDEEEEEEQDEEEVEEEYDYIDKDLECDYVRLVYREMSDKTYRDLVFDDIEVKDYNKTPHVDDSLYIVYKVAEANVKGNKEKEAELRSRIEEELIEAQITNSFINRKIRELREEKNLVIYDPILAEFYSEDVYEKAKRNSKVVAKLDGITITADELYEELKNHAVMQVLNHIDYVALSSIEKLQLTKNEIKDLKERVADLKSSYMQSYYAQFLTWKEFLLTLGARNEDELRNLFALSDFLIERYILGYNDYEGANPITKEDVFEEYNEWLEAGYQSIDASHILFKLDLDGDGEITDEERERAEKLAYQIYYGAGENGEYLIDEKEDEDGWSNIYEIPEDEEEEEENQEKKLFVGLYHTPVKDVENVFKELAREYSEDSSASSGGRLGNFGPVIFRQSGQNNETQVRMVKEFEEVALATGVKEFSEPFETEFGWHVIYVHSKRVAPEAPNNYFNLSEKDIEELIEDGDKELEEYHNFYEKLEKGIRIKRMSTESVNFELAKLRDELKFAFKDDKLQANYKALQTIYLTQDEEEE